MSRRGHGDGVGCPFEPKCVHMDVCNACKSIGLWSTRTTSSGRFDEAKKSGDIFRGVRREDKWSLWDSLDYLHRSLLFLLGIATTGLVLHALGIFV